MESYGVVRVAPNCARDFASGSTWSVYSIAREKVDPASPYGMPKAKCGMTRVGHEPRWVHSVTNCKKKTNPRHPSFALRASEGRQVRGLIEKGDCFAALAMTTKLDSRLRGNDKMLFPQQVLFEQYLGTFALGDQRIKSFKLFLYCRVG